MRWTTMAAAVIAVAAMAGAASPALAQKAEFKVGQVNYTLPIPTGYCVPTRESDVGRMSYAESLDPQHFTVLSLVMCSEDGDLLDYVLIKSPKATVDNDTTLADLMAMLGPEFETRQGADVSLPQTAQRLGESFSERTGQQVDVSMAIGPRGHDDVCAYMGGTVASEALEGGVVALGGCVTVVGGKIIIICFYGRGSDPATVRAMLPRARAVAVSMRARR